ncbi:major facilitator superfamily domain-containing protein [Rhodotorula diobovata]|uniref:Major facilitator superfamily domain-containing protein n=1 Tax=Rhodotorula diobovata TaxID=5288 RepID=A0A5C5FXC1_9BASI|nr:major facilitator superfamily domain-containing protein [Rhodotorula diobovata]
MADPASFAPYLASTSTSTSPSSSRSTSPASSARSSRLTLSGDTPCPTRPPSILEKDDDEAWDAPTRVGSPAPSLCGDEKKVKGDAEKGAEDEAVEVVDEFPEGGLRAWLCVLGSTLVLLVTFGFSNSFGAFMSHYSTHQLAAYTTSQISWIGSAHLFITFSCAFGAGILFDRGWFRYQLSLGSVGWLAGIFGLSFAESFATIFVCQAVVMGLSLGLFFSPCLSILGTYFRRRRAFVVGVAASGTAIGAVIFPVLLGQLFEKKGFAWAVRAAGFMMLGLLLIANLIIRPRKLKSHAPSLTATAPVQQQQPSLGAALRKIVRQPSAWLVCCGVFGVYVSCFIPLFYVGLFAREYSGPGPIATYALSIINAVAFFSRIGSGIVADRLGVFNTALPLGALVAVLTFAMMAAHSTAALAVWLVLFGFAQGGWISVSAACFMSLADDASEIGLRSGIGFFFVALATLIGSPIAGALLAATGGSYVAALCFGGGMAVAGCALLVLGRATQVRRRSSQWV